MSELHKFIFDGLPVRGMLVRLTDGWKDVLARRARASDEFPPPVRVLIGEMAAAGVLMQANIKFNGALILQVFGDGPVKLAVAEVQPDLAFRVTAKVVGEVPDGARLEAMVNVRGQGRCAITLAPADTRNGQQPYQGVVASLDVAVRVRRPHDRQVPPGDERGHEERQTLDVVDLRVREQDRHPLGAALRGLRHQAVAERDATGAQIEDQTGARGGDDLETDRVASVAPEGRTGCDERSSRAPEPSPHQVSTRIPSLAATTSILPAIARVASSSLSWSSSVRPGA